MKKPRRKRASATQAPGPDHAKHELSQDQLEGVVGGATGVLSPSGIPAVGGAGALTLGSNAAIGGTSDTPVSNAAIGGPGEAVQRSGRR
jgi:hypothetical protein